MSGNDRNRLPALRFVDKYYVTINVTCHERRIYNIAKREGVKCMP